MSISSQFWWGISLSLFVVLVYYLAVYLVYKARGGMSSVPRSQVPRSLSPAAARYLYLGEFDSDCLVAALLSAAVKSCYRISWGEDGFRIRMKRYSHTYHLSKDEQAALSYSPSMYVSSMVVSRQKTRSTDKAEQRLHKALRRQYGKLLVRRERLVLLGSGISLACLLANTLWVAPDLFLFVLSYLVAFTPFVVAAMVLLRRGIKTRRWGSVVLAAGAAGMAVLVGGLMAEIQLALLLLPAISSLAIINWGAFWLLPRHTRPGHVFYVELMEFRQYLTARLGEQPEVSPRDAQFLPYLVALDVDFESASYFAPLLSTYQSELKPPSVRVFRGKEAS